MTERRVDRDASESRLAQLKGWFQEPVDSLPLLWLRVSFGLLMAVSAVRFVAKGWVRELYVVPDFHFSYLGFGWIAPPSEAWIYALFAGVFVSSLLMAAGVFYRASIFAFFVLFTTVELFDKTLYLNHYVFVSSLSLLMALLPLGRLGDRMVASWMLMAVRVQVGLVYWFAGIAKLEGDWLLRAQPLATWLPARSDLPVLGALFEQRWVAYGASWGAVLFDLTLPFLLLWGRTRLVAWCAALFFHGLTALLFEIGMFPWIMMCATLVFFEGAELRCAIDRAAKGSFSWWHQSARADSQRACLGSRRTATVAVACLLAVQCVLPLRHWLYPGDVLWTEEGYRFSWRVMLVEKTGDVVFQVKPPGERERPVYPSRYLTLLQESQMSYQPDMILELAHHIAREHGPGTQVRAEARVSVNGRASRLLIDPRVDLAAERPSFWPQAWILRNRAGTPAVASFSTPRRVDWP